MEEFLPLNQGSKMEDSERQTYSHSSLIPIKSRNKGGLMTMPFIIGNGVFQIFWGFFVCFIIKFYFESFQQMRHWRMWLAMGFYQI